VKKTSRPAPVQLSDQSDKPPTQTRSSPAAQALVAGILQGLGKRYGDERMKAEGEKLGREAKTSRS
jgi:hypothetical protein